MRLVSKRFLHPLLLILFPPILFWGCASSKQARKDNKRSHHSMQERGRKLPSQMDRPVANPITNEIPEAFYEAADNGTRTMSGKPGAKYWTQFAKYDLDVELIPADTLVEGSGEITYYNNSPDTLHQLFLELDQNLHKQGIERKSNVEITGGIKLKRVAVDHQELSKLQSRRSPSGYVVDGTLLVVRPDGFVAPGDSITMQMEWDFKVPQKGASGRMGRSRGNLFYIGYWYPQMRVYDDVNGWFTDAFTGNAEFYHDFADYDVNITAPAQWMVASTGTLHNGKDILSNTIYERLQKAHQSDSVRHVVTKNDFGQVTKSTDNGKIRWHFRAKNVSDFAFSATSESKWDATRTPVGDRDGDGQPDYVNINALYRSSAPLWTNGAKFTAHSISFLSDFTDLKYPWPHMTSIEGGGIIGGGMEYPMMTLIGDYKNARPLSLYGVIAHELAHMWVPMMVSSNERRYSWLDEGTTTFNENQAKNEYYPEEDDFELAEFQSYLRITQTDLEGPIMRWSDYQYSPPAYGVASYPKPASMLVSLRHLLGKETFTKAYHTFLKRWQYKHPYPWDLFNTFEDVSGRDLDWFWRSWYYETWTLDQAVGKVMATDDSTRIVIEDRGEAAMPAEIEITFSDGSKMTKTIPVDYWLQGKTKKIITVDPNKKVTRVVIDPDKHYPDANRDNNSWEM